MLTILVFEIKKGKNAQKVKKNINRNLSLLIRGIIPRKFLKFETRNAISCILSIQKIKKLLTIIYHYLVVEKRNNLNRFCSQRQRIKPKTYFPFIYLLIFAGLFV
jgi:hypothetical protein